MDQQLLQRLRAIRAEPPKESAPVVDLNQLVERMREPPPEPIDDRVPRFGTVLARLLFPVQRNR